MTDQFTDLATRHNAAFERITLGAMLTSPQAINDVLATGLEATDLYVPGHQLLFGQILAAQQAGVPTEPQALAAWLADRNELPKGGLAYLVDLLDAVPLAASVGWYAGQLLELADRRRVLTALAQVHQVANSGADAEHLAAVSENVIRAAAPRAKDSDFVFLGDFAEIGIRDIEMRMGDRRGLPTGFTDLDRLLNGGLRAQQLIVVAGRTGMGKSTLVCDIARAVSIRYRWTTAFFAVEMSVQDMYDRILSAEARIPHHAIRSGELNEQDWQRASNRLGPISESRIAFDESTDQTVTRIGNKLRKLQKNHGLDLAIIDHLGLVSDPAAQRQGRQQEVAKIVRDLKVLAKELNIPIIIAVQLNRDAAGRKDRWPQLTDLRESGEIEQSADIVILVHREDYYDRESARAGEADLIVAKNRNGPNDTVTVAAQLHLSRFVDMTIA